MQVEVYDHSKPASPAMVLAGNFDPRLHVRWEFRPSVLEQDWTQAMVKGRGERPDEAVTPEASAQLKAAGFVSVFDVVSRVAELRALTELPRGVAGAVLAFCNDHPAFHDATAELAFIAETGKALIEPSVTPPSEGG